MSDFDDDYDYLRSDDPLADALRVDRIISRFDADLAERRARSHVYDIPPPPCDIPLDGPSAMHSEMAENGDLDEHVATRHRLNVPGVKTMLFLLEEAEEGGYVASVATRPGCISQGETVPEALENLADAWRELDLAER